MSSSLAFRWLFVIFQPFFYLFWLAVRKRRRVSIRPGTSIPGISFRRHQPSGQKGMADEGKQVDMPGNNQSDYLAGCSRACCMLLKRTGACFYKLLGWSTRGLDAHPETPSINSPSMNFSGKAINHRSPCREASARE